jgi:hypothetical protein
MCSSGIGGGLQMNYDTGSIRVYDTSGRERYVRAGMTVPAGWYDGSCKILQEDMKVVAVRDEGNPYEQYRSNKLVLTLQKISPI